MAKLRVILLGLGLLVGSIFGAVLGYGGGIPTLPSSATFNEPSQIVSTLNQLLAALNGNPSPIGSGGTIVSLGAYGTVSGGTPLSISAQRGIATFTAVATLTQGSVSTLVLLGNYFLASSACSAWVQTTDAAAGSAPYISSVTPTAGTLTMILANGGTTATGASKSVAVAFNCTN